MYCSTQSAHSLPTSRIFWFCRKAYLNRASVLSTLSVNFVLRVFSGSNWVEKSAKMSSKKMNKTSLSATVENLNISLVEILMSAKFTDVTLRCGESKLKAHKVLLAVRSQYFEDYFKRNGMVTEIELKVNFEDLKSIILYMYQGVIVIPVDRKASFLELAKLFSVNISEINIFGVRTRMENFAGNGKGCFVFEVGADLFHFCATFHIVYVNRIQ